MNLRDFSSGDCFDAYKWLGAQFDGFGTTFRVYAPNAEGVSVIGDFNGWQDWYLNRTGDGKFWEIRITDARFTTAGTALSTATRWASAWSCARNSLP